MFGLRIKVICPYCGQEHIVSLGCSTGYYKINNSEYSYTKCQCYLCKEKYWLSHTIDGVRDVKKVNESDKLDWTHTTCW